jgi:hypothetical protein
VQCAGIQNLPVIQQDLLPACQMPVIEISRFIDNKFHILNSIIMNLSTRLIYQFLQTTILGKSLMRSSALLAGGMIIIFSGSFTGINDPGKTVKVAPHTVAPGKPVTGGDFSLDFVAAGPLTYVHQTGGGAYDDRTIGKDLDVVESLEGGDFKCGDRVTYLTAIKVAATATGAQTIKLDYSFLAASTGQPGVALCQFKYVGVNSGVVSGGDGAGGTDAGLISNGNETASLDGGYPGTIHGTVFQKGATLDGTVTITGLEAGEQVIVRVDVVICCQIPSSPTGNLQASITGAKVTSPVFNKRDATISVGNQTVPFKNVNLIGQADCLLNDFTSACVGQIVSYTANTSVSSPTRTWSLSGDAVFIDLSDNTISDPGNVASVRVRATNAGSGSYAISVVISALQHDPATCSDTVGVYPVPVRPSVTYNPPACDATTFSITVTAPLDSTGRDFQYSNNGGTSWQDSTTFTGIAAGAGFSVTVRNKADTSCVSNATTCSNYQTVSFAPNVPKEAVTMPRKGAGSLPKASLLAFPNPYNDEVRFDVKAFVTGEASLEIYNLQGQRIYSVYRGIMKAGVPQTFIYKVPASQRTPLVYVLNSGGEIITGKLLSR